MQRQINSNEAQKLQQLAHSMFKQILNQQRIEIFISLSPQHLGVISREAGRLFHRKLKKKPYQILAFLNSYHKVIMGYTDKVANQIINNLSLHFILLSSYAMIENGQRLDAKELLKKALNYLDSTDPDPILLTTALNNLCILWIGDKKYYKAVNVLFQMVEIMETHMKTLKLGNQKGQAMEDSVFLVNTYFLLSKCLSKIKLKNNQSFYRELYHKTSQIGMKKALKYLGKQSFLTKRFIELTKNDIQIELPVFRRQQVQKSGFEQKFLSHLIKIQQMLANQKPVIIEKIVQVPSVPPPPPPVVPPPNNPKMVISPSQDLVCQCSKMINDWNVEIQILKEKQQKIGSVVFRCQKGNDQINLIVGQQKFIKLLTQMNIQDILPAESHLQSLAPRELIEICIFNFIYIDDNKNIQLFPRAHCFATNLNLQFFGKEYILFLYHIKGKEFRLAFGVKTQASTSHLELQLNEQFFTNVFDIKEESDRRIFKIYRNLMELKGKENNMKHVPDKQLKVKDSSALNKGIEAILRKFEIFLKTLKTENQLKDIFKQDNQFYKFVQGKEADNGRFYFIRFLKNIKGFEVNVENTYETHSPEGKTKAKGQILYSSFQFFRDFGISSNVGMANFRCFCQILTKKYDIRSYENPLTSRDIEIYQQNSINEVKIAFKTYLRQMIQHKNYILPLTACIVSINNQIPVGIKLTGYNPESCYEVGFFIHLNHQMWKWPEKPGQQPQDYLNNVVEQYAYKREYFLVDWLEQVGFRKLISLLRVDDKDNFYVHGLGGNFFRLANFIDKMQ